MGEQRVDKDVQPIKSTIVPLAVEQSPDDFANRYGPLCGLGFRRGKWHRVNPSPVVTPEHRSFVREEKPVIFPSEADIATYHGLFTRFYELEAQREAAGIQGILHRIRQVRDSIPTELSEGRGIPNLSSLNIDAQYEQNRTLRSQISVVQAVLCKQAVALLKPYYDLLAQKVQRLTLAQEEKERAEAERYGVEFTPSPLSLALAFISIFECPALENSLIDGFPTPPPENAFFRLGMWEPTEAETLRANLCAQAIAKPLVSARDLERAREKAILDGDRERARLAHVEEVKKLSEFNDRLRLEGERESARKRAERDAAERPLKVVVTNQP